MLGEVTHEGMSFQLDLGATDVDDGFQMAETTVGLAQPSLAHRRVNDLELDPVFSQCLLQSTFM